MQRVRGTTYETDYVSVFSSDLGWMAVATHANVVRRLTFGHETPAEAVAAIHGAQNDVVMRGGDFAARLVERLTSYAAGEFDDFQDIEVDETHLSDFAASVVAATRRISYGATSSYGELALAAGRPRAARAVGRIMAQNRTPLIVPCHRVIGAGGCLGGFSAPNGLAMKRRLLQLESHAYICAR